MRVKLRYANQKGKQFSSKREITVKEATEYYKNNLKNNTDIVKVFLTHFDGWHIKINKTLK